MAVLTSLRISHNFEGVTNEIGRYPFAKILMLCIDAAGLLIPCVMQCIYLALFLNKVMNLWSSDENLVSLHSDLNVSELCCLANNLSCEDVVLCIWCTVSMGFSNVSAL